MTYCVGVLVEDGLIMLADTRTNAGVDNISVYRKLHVFEQPGKRVLAIATAGSLSTTQAAMSLLREGVRNPDTGQIETLDDCLSVFRAAQLVGHALRKARADMSGEGDAQGINFDATILLGGQYVGGPLQLFLIYSEGNFIECGPETPYLQIGELKYGKPILDRAVTFESSLQEALKIALISFDSTLRSNLAVGPPIDMLIARRGDVGPVLQRRISQDDPYFRGLSEQWSAALHAALDGIQAPPYLADEPELQAG